MGLKGRGDILAVKLPYGDQRRLEIARALANKPRLLLLDEPTAGMNPAEIAEMTDFIRRLRDELGITILLIEHEMRVVMGISEQITVLDYGQKIAEGTPQRDPARPARHRGLPGPQGRGGSGSSGGHRGGRDRRRVGRHLMEPMTAAPTPVLAVDRPQHLLRQHPCPAGHLAEVGDGRDRDAHRRQRRRQDHDPQHDQRPAPAAQRPDPSTARTSASSRPTRS